MAMAGSAETTCSCPLSAASNDTLYLQSQPLSVFSQSKSITNLPGDGYYDVCGSTDVDYMVSLSFSAGAGTWAGSTLTDNLAGGQTYWPEPCSTTPAAPGPQSPRRCRPGPTSP